MRSKKMLVLLVCLVLIFSVGCGGEKVEPRETEVVQLVVHKKYDEAKLRAKELYEGEELVEMLEWIDKYEKPKTNSNTSTSKLEIQSDSTHTFKNGYIYITGKVKNVSSDSISYFEIVVDLLDGKNNILHSEYTNDGLELKPNALREFEIVLKSKDEYENYKLSIGKVK